jgi:hypothetical protein
MAHRFHFFRAGGVDQVSLRDGKDLRALVDLDPKLWVALAMPTTGVDVDPETLALLDTDKDGRVRKDDIVAAIKWIVETFKEPGDVLKSATSVRLSAIADAKVVTAAKRMLTDLGKGEEKVITLDDIAEITKAFASTALNGDGVVTELSTTDEDLKRVIADAIGAKGSVVDRSGKPGVSQTLADPFFADVDAVAAWASSEAAPQGAGSEAAASALEAVRGKLEDYFTRCQISAFDARGGAALAGADADVAALAPRTLSATDDELAKLPIAKVTPTARLDLGAALNPAWSARVKKFADDAVKPVLGAKRELGPDDLAAIVANLAPYVAWRALRPASKVADLDPAWLAKLAAPELRAKLAKLIEDDAALAPEYEAITSVTKLVRFQRDFGRILRNFASFSDFYSKQDGIFQSGVLYLDARALHLAIHVADAAKHATLAMGSDAYLAYLDCTRLAEKQQIVVAVTNGDADNLFVGRNGVFYDRKGQDWDATISRIVSNPISVREAFWTPYKKLVKVIEDNVTKRATAAQGDSSSAIEGAGKGLAEADKAAVAAPAAAAPPAAGKKIDLGTVAAIGVAIGGIGTLIGTVFGTLFGLGMWLPVGIVAVMLLISGPSMLLAWLKLRRRNLGPILDANGWAVNGRARINVPFGAALTELAVLPDGSVRSLEDPFADKRTPWKRWVALAIVIVLAGTWFVGRLDGWLPEKARSTSVLGTFAPAAAKPAASAAPAAGSAAPSAAPSASAAPK